MIEEIQFHNDFVQENKEETPTKKMKFDVASKPTPSKRGKGKATTTENESGMCFNV